MSVIFIWASLVAQMVKNLPAMQKTRVQSLGQENTLEKGMATHSSILAHGQRSLVSYSPWGRKESDTTERLSLHFSSFTLSGKARERQNLETMNTCAQSRPTLRPHGL